jgi:hypothetical protein
MIPWAGRKTAATALAALVVAGLASGADTPKKQAKKAAAKAAQAEVPVSKEELREAREIFRAFQDLANSVSRDDEGSRKSKADPEAGVAAMDRPARTVTPPTIDATAVDALLDKSLVAAKVQPARLTSDEEFVRRVCLDVCGKLPTPEQVQSFLRNTKKDKRATLIDSLLDTREYAQNWARYWRDVVRFHATAENPRLINFPKYEEWLTEQLARNAPWDEISKAVITATGSTDQDGATAFTVAHMAQPVEVAGEVSRVFLGVQIQCAQCHDHPTDSWKREQFHEFAAFFAGTNARRNAMGGQATGMILTARPGVPRYTMPDLKDPHKSIPVEPKFFLARSETLVPKSLNAQQRRVLAASYVTGQDNPWFAKAFVNRMWCVLLGDGFYNPVDDIGPDREAHDSAVLDALASGFQQGGYDIKWLLRTILNTRAYQREFRPSNTAAGKTPFAANCPSRLRADQIFDSLDHALGLNIEKPGRARDRANAEFNKKLQERLKGQPKMVQDFIKMAAEQLRGPRTPFNLLYGVDPSMPNDDVLGTIPQALFLMNGPQVNRAIKAENGTVLGEILASTPNNREALERLYLRVLARRPTAKELELLDHYANNVNDRREVFEDILWCLVNSTEFISRR